MKTLIIALTLAALTSLAQAQTALPKTMKLYNNQNGQVVGTATQNGRTLYLRDLKGELVGSATLEANGKKTFRDPSGNIVDSLSIAGPPVKLPDEP